MTEKLISVIVPVYNHQKYIVQALASIADQTYQNLEVIVIDDGSSDKSVETVRDFLKARNDSRFQFHVQANQGAHNTINRGLAMATGDFLTILNSDDYYHVNRLSKMLSFLNEQKSEIGFSMVEWIDGEGNPVPDTNETKSWYNKLNYEEGNYSPTIGAALLEGNIAVSTGNFIFSRKVYETVGGFRDFIIAHDLDFLMRALPYFEPSYLKEALLYYRLHGSNTNSKYASRVVQELEQIWTEYTLGVDLVPPPNRLAPCRWYWPAIIRQSTAHKFVTKHFEKTLLAPGKFPENSAPELQASANLNILKKHHSVTLITHELSLSGAPKLVADLAISLQAQGCKVNILSRKDGPMAELLTKNGFTVKIIPEVLGIWVLQPTRFRRLLAYLGLVVYLAFNTSRVTLINSSANWPLLPAFYLFRHFKKCIFYIHESYALYASIPVGKIHNSLPQILKHPGIQLWFGSASTREVWRASGFDGNVVYWSGLKNPASAIRPRTRIKQLLTVGTVSARKGTHYLIDAFFHCIENQQIPEDVELFIVGMPEKYNSFFSDLFLKIKTSPHAQRVKLIPSLPPELLEEYFLQSDLYIQSSIMECLPISLLQAMSLGLPILTTEVDGCKEAIQNKVNGYSCPARDIHGLANRIAHAVNHPEEGIELGKQAREDFMKKFSLEVTEPAMLKTFEESV